MTVITSQRVAQQMLSCSVVATTATDLAFGGLRRIGIIKTARSCCSAVGLVRHRHHIYRSSQALIARA